MILEAQNLSFKYNPGQTVLNGISLSIAEKELLVLAGVNGCGKSTLLKCLAGLHRCSAGMVLLNGTPMHKLSRQYRAQHIAFMSQSPEIPPGYSVRELVMCGRFPWNSSRRENIDAVEKIMTETGIDMLQNRQLDQLSGGERQKVFLAMALVQQPQILLLDEPFSALDPAAAWALFALINRMREEHRLAVVMVLHDINRALHCGERIVGLKQGKILFDLPADNAAEYIPELYDLPPEAVIHNSGQRLWFL